MTSSASSSSRLLALAGALSVALGPPARGAATIRQGEPAADPATPGTQQGARDDGAVPRVAIFPVDNVSGGSAPVAELRAGIEAALARAGLEAVGGERIDQFLRRHRVRYTGGLDLATAQRAGEELGVGAVLLASVELYAAAPPRLGLTMRLVSATSEARVLWIDGVARAGDESPGLLGLGIITSPRELEERVLDKLARSAAAALGGKGPVAPRCEGAGRFRPRIRYRSSLLEPGHPPAYSVAVVPFHNLTTRRNAGDAVALEVLRGLAGSNVFRVVEPGVVRQIILENRVVMEGGISVDQVRTLLKALGAELVVAGDVVEYLEGPDPAVNLTTTILDGRTGEIVWQSTSHARGSDGVWFFELGTVRTAGALACRIVRTAVDELYRTRAVPRVERPAQEAPAPPRSRRDPAARPAGGGG